MSDYDHMVHIRDIMRTNREFKEISQVAMCGYVGSNTKGIFGYWPDVMKGRVQNPCKECQRAWSMEENSSKLSVAAQHRIRVRMMSVVNMRMKKAVYGR